MRCTQGGENWSLTSNTQDGTINHNADRGPIKGEIMSFNSWFCVTRPTPYPLEWLKVVHLREDYWPTLYTPHFPISSGPYQ
jgi:hypothetical protein